MPSGRGGVGVEVESCAECCSAGPVAGPGADRVMPALVPGGCAGQSPARGGGSLRTPAGPARGPFRGGCPASPGRGAWGLAPGRSGLGPVRPGGLGVIGDDRGGLETVDDRRDGHLAAGAVGERRGLVGEAAGGDALPGPVVAVALPSATGVRADGPLPARPGGPVRCGAVAQRGEAAGAVPGGVRGGHGDDGDAASAARWRRRSVRAPRTCWDRRVLRLRPMPLASIDRRSST
jgi:hypothetical protein